MTVVLATRNQHKIDELRAILAGTGLPLDLVGLDRFPDMPEVEETGLTFAENALLKARAVATFTNLPAIADDSGLCVAALNGMPGVISARWAGGHGDGQANLDLVLAQLSHVPAGDRPAWFACAAALVVPGTPAVERVVEGRLDGQLTTKPRGTGGFGYDPIFQPEGSGLTTAELEPVAKNAISHRGRAFRALAPLLQELLPG